MARLRKAAFVLASLPNDEAKALLSRLPTRQLEAVVTEIATLGAVWNPERRQAMAEFAAEILAGQAVDERSKTDTPKDDVSGEWNEEKASRTARARNPCYKGEETQRLFSSLAQGDPRDAAARLQKERPQVAALLVAQLPRREAMGILAELPSAMQADVIRRMATLEPIDPGVLSDLAHAFHSTKSSTAPAPVHAATAG